MLEVSGGCLFDLRTQTPKTTEASLDSAAAHALSNPGKVRIWLPRRSKSLFFKVFPARRYLFGKPAADFQDGRWRQLGDYGRSTKHCLKTWASSPTFFCVPQGWEPVGIVFDPENPMKNSMNSMRMCLCSTSCCCHKLLTARRQGSARFFFNVQETPWGI